MEGNSGQVLERSNAPAQLQIHEYSGRFGFQVCIERDYMLT